MLSALRGVRDDPSTNGDADVLEEQGEVVDELNQQPQWGQAPLEAEGPREQPTSGDAQALRAVWANGRQDGPSSSATTTATQAAGQRTALDVEDEEDRRERRLLEASGDIVKAHRVGLSIDTIGSAVEYCEELVSKQLHRAEMAAPPANSSIYGDLQARRAITTLLPDAFVRRIFLQTTRRKEAWPRIRPLFGSPPYVFLHPEDAGFVRAAGISSGRVNMTYERIGEVAAYSQFGSGHLVDTHARDYRVVPTRTLSASDPLPSDIGKLGEHQFICMHVRVPKRTREQKRALMRNSETRRAVMFPAVGEVLALSHSKGLQKVLQKVVDGRIGVRVRSVVPRGTNSSTASIVVIKV